MCFCCSGDWVNAGNWQGLRRSGKLNFCQLEKLINWFVLLLLQLAKQGINVVLISRSLDKLQKLATDIGKLSFELFQCVFIVLSINQKLIKISIWKSIFNINWLVHWEKVILRQLKPGNYFEIEDTLKNATGRHIAKDKGMENGQQVYFLRVYKILTDLLIKISKR